jgi:hypothetical protein
MAGNALEFLNCLKLDGSYAEFHISTLESMHSTKYTKARFIVKSVLEIQSKSMPALVTLQGMAIG